MRQTTTSNKLFRNYIGVNMKEIQKYRTLQVFLEDMLAALKNGRYKQ
jgi:hypothetical protein